MLVIFDCDGVLVDSEHLAARVFARQLALYGIVMTPEQCEAKFRGHTMNYCFNELLQQYPGELPSDFLETLAVATERYFTEHLKPVQGIEAVLHWLRSANIPFCVASNGALRKIRHSLDVAGLARYFADRCFSAEFVPQGKPEPDLFLAAARQMGFSPQQTLVVEDSLAGVTAARRAGMTVFAYGATFEANEEDDVIPFTHMSELRRLIESYQPTR